MNDDVDGADRSVVATVVSPTGSLPYMVRADGASTDAPAVVTDGRTYLNGHRVLLRDRSPAVPLITGFVNEPVEPA